MICDDIRRLRVESEGLEARIAQPREHLSSIEAFPCLPADANRDVSKHTLSTRPGFRFQQAVAVVEATLPEVLEHLPQR